MPENKPKSVEDVWEGRSSWYLTYRHDFLHYGVIQSFIVRTQSLAEMRDIWKSGISLKDTHNGAVHYALVECQGNEIRVRVTEGGIALLNKIRNLFEELRDSKGTETVSLDGENYVLLDELKNRSKDNPKLKTVNGTWVEAAGLKVFLERDEKVSFEEPESNVRGLGKEDKPLKKMIDNSKPYPVPMAEGARAFVHLSKVKEKIKILFLAATPMKAGQLNSGKESRFKDLFRYFDTEKRFLLKEEHGITSEQFQQFVINEKPHIVHYGGHGNKEGVVLEDENLDADILSNILQLSAKVQCVVLNACNSFAIAKDLAQHIPYVIGTQHVIDDRTAIAFAKGFYLGIVSNITIEEAFQSGIIAVKREKLPGADVLILVKGIPKT